MKSVRSRKLQGILSRSIKQGSFSHLQRTPHFSAGETSFSTTIADGPTLTREYDAPSQHPPQTYFFDLYNTGRITHEHSKAFPLRHAGFGTLRKAACLYLLNAPLQKRQRGGQEPVRVLKSLRTNYQTNWRLRERMYTLVSTRCLAIFTHTDFVPSKEKVLQHHTTHSTHRSNDQLRRRNVTRNVLIAIAASNEVCSANTKL